MNFEKFLSLVQAQFTKMCANGKLFRIELPYKLDENADVVSTGHQLWDLYLNSFRKEDNPIFRHSNSSTYNCNNDKHFIKRYGNVVAIIDNQIVTMWDLDLDESNPFYLSCKAMSNALKNGEISNVFVETYKYLHNSNYEKTGKNQPVYRLGREKEYVSYTEDKTFGRVKANEPYEFWFFHIYLPKQFIDFSGDSVEKITGELRTTRQLFEKTLSIPLETLELVRDLIIEDKFKRADGELPKIKKVIEIKNVYDNLDVNKSVWLWNNMTNDVVCKFANCLVGEACMKLSKGESLNGVITFFNRENDSSKKYISTKTVTTNQIEIAEKKLIELGYISEDLSVNSFERRFANIDDINVNEIKHCNYDNSKDKPLGLFGKAGVPTNNQISQHKKAEFDKVETVTIDKFMSDILPNASSVEVFLENRMKGNLVSLLTTVDKNAKNILKWDNSFNYNYYGNLSGKSSIKETVSSKGGKVDGILRCSIVWNDENQNDSSDLDLWCTQPNKEKIGFDAGFRKDSGDKLSSCGGQLDLDDRGHKSNIHAENIYFISKSRLLKGTYGFYVHQYLARNSKGFKAEIEVNGDIYTYIFDKSVSGNVKIADVKYDGVNFSIIHHLPEASSSQKLWNLDTNQFHKVNLICLSPNHWGNNNVGTKEYFFMLQDCKTNEPAKPFHISQLNSELLENRKSLDLLANYKLIEPADKQLSGLGFNCTERDELIVKVKGSHQRVLKILF